MASVLLALLLHGEAGVPLLREWFLSFGIVAVHPVIPGPVAGVPFQSLKFCPSVEGRGLEGGKCGTISL
jgi:hypothetical protein